MEGIDYMSMSLEELNQQLTEYQKKSSDFYNTEQGIKLTLNSIYGATGNQYFALFNPDVAESVTFKLDTTIKPPAPLLDKEVAVMLA